MVATVDAVLIGAGVNSLACAAHMAARGKRVAIFEQAQTPGGAVKSGAYTLPGFTHDWAAMNLSLFAGSPFQALHGAELAKHGLAFAPVAHPFASAFPDRSWMGVSADRALTTARIRGHDAEDGAAWEALSADFPNQAETIFAILGASMKKRAFASIGWKTWRKIGAPGMLDMGRFLTASPRCWLEETFRSPKVRAMLGAWGMHLDFAPDIAGGAVFPYLEGMAGQAFGMVLAEGGAQTVTDALVRMIEARGGQIHCGAEVTRILHKDGRASGIELADGSTVEADTVIANVSPRAMLRLTGGTRTARYDMALERFSYAPGTMMIHLATDGLPDWAAGASLQRFAYVHLAPSLDQMARTYAQAKAGLLPDEPVIVCGQPTVADPSRAPEGKHVLWLQVRMVPGSIKGDSAGQIAGRDWAEVAEPYAERVLDLVERYAPGLRGRILGTRIVPPTELEADNPNLVGGDQVCGSHHLTQHFMYRPVRGHADGTTPIRGLYHTGAAVWPGGGTGAGPGFLLGKALVGE